MDIQQYDRETFWSMGILTDDITSLVKATQKGEVSRDIMSRALKKLGDAVGCPIPDKVAHREGLRKAILYLGSLLHDYTSIKQIVSEFEVPWADEWGREEVKHSSPGEDSSHLPPSIREKGIVRGPGKYHEFSITRLMWIDKNKANHLTVRKLRELVLASGSIIEFHVRILAELATVLTTDELSLGICHEGFFRQNNPYAAVRGTLNLLQQVYGKATWFHPLKREVERVLGFPVTPPS